jgi:hypothetical protein
MAKGRFSTTGHWRKQKKRILNQPPARKKRRTTTAPGDSRKEAPTLEASPVLEDCLTPDQHQALLHYGQALNVSDFLMDRTRNVSDMDFDAWIGYLYDHAPSFERVVNPGNLEVFDRIYRRTESFGEFTALPPKMVLKASAPTRRAYFLAGLTQQKGFLYHFPAGDAKVPDEVTNLLRSEIIHDAVRPYVSLLVPRAILGGDGVMADDYANELTYALVSSGCILSDERLDPSLNGSKHVVRVGPGGYIPDYSDGSTLEVHLAVSEPTTIWYSGMVPGQKPNSFPVTPKTLRSV